MIEPRIPKWKNEFITPPNRNGELVIVQANIYEFLTKGEPGMIVDGPDRQIDSPFPDAGYSMRWRYRVLMPSGLRWCNDDEIRNFDHRQLLK